MRIAASTPSGEARRDPIGAWLREQAAVVLGSEEGVRVNAPDAVHQMRIALRRMRSCLRTFSKGFDGPAAEELDGELAWLGSLLGNARDAEVITARVLADFETLDPTDVLGPVRERLHDHLDEASLVARQTLISGLDAKRYRRLLERLVAFAADPPIQACATEGRWLRHQLRRQVHRTERRVAALPGAPGPARDLALHKVRKAAKHVRYAGELLSAREGSRARHLAERFEALQEVLGEVQDRVVVSRLVRDEGARAAVGPGENGFTYGVLVGVERSGAERGRAKFGHRWQRARRAARRFPA